jgi:putative ABC transport system permease protein
VDLDGRVVEPPAGGVILSGRLARQLDVGAGDTIVATLTEGDRRRLELPVAAVVETPLGSSPRLDRARLNRLLREGDSLSGAYLSVDRARLPAIYARLKRTPMVAAVTARETVVQGVRDTVAENMGIVTLFNTGFAGLIVLGVVYNSARISLSERARDLASLRVLGFRRAEVGFVLLGELALLVLASLPLGLVLGVALSRYLSARFSADLYTIPFGINVATLAQGVLVVAAAAAGTAILIRSRTDRLDLVRALKTRE